MCIWKVSYNFWLQHFQYYCDVFYGVLCLTVHDNPTTWPWHATLTHLAKSRSSCDSTLSFRLSATLLGCQVCVIWNSKGFNSFILKLCIMSVHMFRDLIWKEMSKSNIPGKEKISQNIRCTSSICQGPSRWYLVCVVSNSCTPLFSSRSKAVFLLWIIFVVYVLCSSSFLSVILRVLIYI